MEKQQQQPKSDQQSDQKKQQKKAVAVVVPRVVRKENVLPRPPIQILPMFGQQPMEIDADSPKGIRPTGPTGIVAQIVTLQNKLYEDHTNKMRASQEKFDSLMAESRKNFVSQMEESRAKFTEMMEQSRATHFAQQNQFVEAILKIFDRNDGK
ncbi:hypothetical protein niasHS_006366 [Heterodera schachtii]|uniref:Uncharacterized protein n=1 Tax=Heterodera schachtii TaxID=97005 RepID=A0ABD2JWI1_HETSC